MEIMEYLETQAYKFHRIIVLIFHMLTWKLKYTIFQPT